MRAILIRSLSLSLSLSFSVLQSQRLAVQFNACNICLRPAFPVPRVPFLRFQHPLGLYRGWRHTWTYTTCLLH